MKNIIFLFVLIVTFSCSSNSTETDDKKAILGILETQRKAWSNHDIEGFMEGYWKNDSLKFYGSNGVTYGWKNTFASYKKRYPTKDHTGILSFKIKDVSKINDGAYFVMGEYHIIRPVGNANGVFMLIFKKIDGKWKIIADTSC